MDKQVNEILKMYNKLNKNIEIALNEGKLKEAELLISDYKIFSKDKDIYTQKAILYFQKQENNKAIKILEEGLKKHPFSYDINFNLGFIYSEIGQRSEGFKYYLYAAKYAISAEQQKNAIQMAQGIVDRASKRGDPNFKNFEQKVDEYQQVLQEVDGRIYPLDYNRKSMIRKVQKAENHQQYLVNMYKSYSVPDVDLTSRMFFKSELIKGTEVKNKTTLQLEFPSVIPVSLIHPNTRIEFLMEEDKFVFNKGDLSHNKFHYINIDKPGKLIIKADNNIFVGNPIERTEPAAEKKVVLKIFVDGLSMKFLEQEGLEKLMPNTYRFFKNGFISTNCYGTSEWTLPCKASVHTGNYATKHKLLHPNFNYPFEKYNKLMAEYFKEAGYLTANISSNWRITPTFGYYKGFDRIIYQNFLGGMDCKDIVMETIEHLESFKFKNNFLAISMTDLHNVPDEIENHLMAEVNTDISYRVNTNNKGITSVQTKYDEHKIYKYGLEIKRVDTFLGTLYDYLTKNYSEDEVVVLLHSDHGQSFLENKNSILHDSRIKIPMMIKGTGVPEGSSDEIIEMIDILPVLLKTNRLDIPENIDGKLPKIFGGENERDYSIVQVIHPGQPYRAIIKDKEHNFHFETKEIVKNDLTIYIEDYQSSLIDQLTGKDVTNVSKDIKEKYESIIFNHIKEFIRWDK
ncbi:sulfatase-like hydrolase/transferase [Domibacillus robiginosus]|uniref:sulfatase-like hydrolase/transferase n=1 Tax=Domibacillus robiginosus TaxID=1071054 RepID=UPI00067B8FAA|nr:sulfatase-like hydrolase/transferase [Domibacillus robiginosus]